MQKQNGILADQVKSDPIYGKRIYLTMVHLPGMYDNRH